MDGPTLFQKLLDRSGLNAHSLSKKLENSSLQSGYQRFLERRIKEPKRNTLQPAADFFGVSVEAFYSPELADVEWARLSGAPASPDSGAHAPSPISSLEAVSPAPPDGYIRLEHLSPSPSMGGGAYLDEPVHVVRHLDVLEQWVRQKVGTTDPGRIKVLTGNGQSMLPTIQDQDLVFVDIAQRTIEVAGIYVIDVAGRLLLKKALILSDGTLILRSDNTADYPDEERHDLRKVADTICVAGRVLAWWTLRRG